MRTPVPIGRLQAATDFRASHSRTLLARPVLAWRTIAVAALLSLALAGALLGVSFYRGRGGARPQALPSANRGVSRLVALSSLPTAAQGPISEALGAKSSTYRVRASPAGLEADNPAQHLRAHFGRSGVTLRSGALQEGLSLRAVGFGTSLIAVGDLSRSAAANRVRYTRRGLTEWYVNGPLGLEQGFTIAHAPSAGPGALTLSMALSGNAHVTIAAGGKSAALSLSSAGSLRYAGLVATDAQGRALHSWLELHAQRLLLRVDTHGASYPLRIDPFVQQAKLEGAGEVGGGHLAPSVALSADGNTALVGAPYERGAAWVFTRSGSSWTQQAKLEGAGEIGRGKFGRSVALSSDGDTALVGGTGDNEGAGAVWVFTRSDSGWAEQARLEAGGETNKGKFGRSLSLSAEGDTALIGGGRDNGGEGAAWVFTRSESSWTQQAELDHASEAGDPYFASSLSLSADGDTAVVGDPGSRGQIGAAWVFTRSGSSWTQQAKLEGGEEIGKGQFGHGVAVSADGDTALIGASTNDGGVGAAWVFTRSGSSWTPQAKFGGGEEAGEGEFGGSVALSSDGGTALIGGAGDSSGAGAAWLFTAAGTLWVQQGSKLTAGEDGGEDAFGSSVALSADAGTALIGGIAEPSDVGAAWVFGPPPPTVTRVEPAEGPASGGTAVTITGSGFTSASTVSFGAVEAGGVTFESATQIKAVSPAGSGTVEVTVTSGGVTSATSPADSFSYTPAPPPPPTVTRVEPAEGPASGGTAVTITGSGFTSASTVSFGAVEAGGVTFESATQIKAVSPAGSGTVEVTVTSGGVTSATSPADSFSYTPAPPPPPTVTRVEPAEGPASGGTAVTITGSGFTSASTVSFGAVEAGGVTFESATQIKAVSPAGSGHGRSDRDEWRGHERHQPSRQLQLHEHDSRVCRHRKRRRSRLERAPVLGGGCPLADAGGERKRRPGVRHSAHPSARQFHLRAPLLTAPGSVRHGDQRDQRQDRRDHRRASRRHPDGRILRRRVRAQPGARRRGRGGAHWRQLRDVSDRARARPPRPRERPPGLWQTRRAQTVGQRSRQLLDEGQLRCGCRGGHGVADRGSM
jgi:hypothetical protein